MKGFALNILTRSVKQKKHFFVLLSLHSNMEIRAEQKKEVDKIVKKHGLDFVVFFGSQANGKERQGSDLDIAVKDKKNETYKRFGDLFNDFSKVFRGINVDLRFIKGSEPVFLYNVFMKGQFIAGDLQNFYQYKAFAYKNYVDSKDLFELKDKLLRKRQKYLNKKIKC